jgi:excisionase family DNA binding protein
MNSDDLFTAPQVAKICSTDLKTIHNWVNRGEINYFRTPGRHLRFRRQDILEFLKKFGYPIPDGFAPSKPKVVLIDSNPETSSKIANELSQNLEVIAFKDHMDALLAIGKDKPALILINGSAGPEMLKLVAKISQNEKNLPVTVFGQSETLKGQASASGAAEYISTTDPLVISQRISSILGIAG